MAKTRHQREASAIQWDRLRLEATYDKRIRNAFLTLGAFYGFSEVSPSPVDDLESYALLMKYRLLGERAPITCKVQDAGVLAFSVSGALSVLRMLSAHGIEHGVSPAKLLFLSENIFLSSIGEKRLCVEREVGFVHVGESNAVAEAELMQIIWRGFAEIGLSADGIEVRLNALGCAACRPAFRSSFSSFLRGNARRFCEKCRLESRSTPTAILICEDEKCLMLSSSAPQVLDFLCDGCKKHLRSILEFLEEVGIPYRLDTKLFREGSWFDRIVFEYTSLSGVGERASSENRTYAEGGRMSRAGELLFGKPTDVVSASVHIETVTAALSDRGAGPKENLPHVFLAQLGELAKRRSLNILEKLRVGDIRTVAFLGRDSIKSQLGVAARSGAMLALILGQKEALDGTIIVREVETGIQEVIPQEGLTEYIVKRVAILSASSLTPLNQDE